jgi:hypothetical protein
VRQPLAYSAELVWPFVIRWAAAAMTASDTSFLKPDRRP